MRLLLLLVCCCAAFAVTSGLSLSVPMRPPNSGGESQQKQQSSANAGRIPTMYTRGSGSNRRKDKDRVQLRIPARDEAPKKERIQLRIPARGQAEKREEDKLRLRIPARPKERQEPRIQLQVPRRAPGMQPYHNDAMRHKAQSKMDMEPMIPKMGNHALSMVAKAGTPQLRVPMMPGAKEEHVKQAAAKKQQMFVPQLRQGLGSSQKKESKRPSFTLRVPTLPGFEKQESRTSRPSGIRLSVPARTDKAESKSSRPSITLKIPTANFRNKKRDVPKDEGLSSLESFLKAANRNRRSADEEDDKDFVVEDHVVKIMKDEDKKDEEEMKADKRDSDPEADALEALKESEMAPYEKNKNKIQQRVRTVVNNVARSTDRLMREKALLEDDLNRLQSLSFREEDLEERIEGKLERIYEKLEELVGDKEKLSEYMSDEIVWDAELTQRMDEELDNYEIERVKAEVEWRREQQKADKLIRTNFKGETESVEEEATILQLLDDRIRELSERRQAAQSSEYADYYDQYS